MNALTAKFNLACSNATATHIKYVNSVKSSKLNNNRKKQLINIATIEYTHHINKLRMKYNYDANVLTQIKNNSNSNNSNSNSNISKSKKALLIGNNYSGRNQLYGCINDAHDIQSFLIPHKFTVTVLTDQSGANILSGLSNLLSDASIGDTLVFTFSGHGSLIPDKSGDELSGQDSVIYGNDLSYISDDTLNKLVKTKMKENCTLIVLSDSCHSGTIFDLQHTFTESSNYLTCITNNKEPTLTNKNIIVISGSRDDQTSADAVFNGRANGAMTKAFLEVMNANKNNTITYQTLLQQMKKWLTDNGFTQIPLCSTNSTSIISNKCFIY